MWSTYNDLYKEYDRIVANFDGSLYSRNHFDTIVSLRRVSEQLSVVNELLIIKGPYCIYSDTDKSRADQTLHDLVYNEQVQMFNDGIECSDGGGAASGLFAGLLKREAGKVVNKTTTSFWKSYNKLPKDIQKVADEKFELFKQNPELPGLNFEKLKGFDNMYSVRINDQYRAIGELQDGVITWTEIIPHTYNRLR